jgi:hypothetical protein
MTRIQLKRGPRAGLPSLREGELAFCTDTNEIYIGTKNNGNVRLSCPEGFEDSLELVDNRYICANKNFTKMVSKKSVKGNLAPYITL